MIDKLAPRIVSTLGRSTRFTLVPESRVLTHRAYRAAAEDPRVVRVQPSAIEIGAKAVEVLLARFDDTLAGRAVDRVQSVK